MRAASCLLPEFGVRRLKRDTREHFPVANDKRLVLAIHGYHETRLLGNAYALSVGVLDLEASCVHESEKMNGPIFFEPFEFKPFEFEPFELGPFEIMKFATHTHSCSMTTTTSETDQILRACVHTGRLHMHSADAEAPGYQWRLVPPMMPTSDDDWKPANFHACAAMSYTVLSRLLKSGRISSDAARAAHDTLVKATERGYDIDACKGLGLWSQLGTSPKQ